MFLLFVCVSFTPLAERALTKKKEKSKKQEATDVEEKTDEAIQTNTMPVFNKSYKAFISMKARELSDANLGRYFNTSLKSQEMIRYANLGVEDNNRTINRFICIYL